VIVGEQAHATILRALRMLGLGEPRRIPVDAQGAIEPDAPAGVEGPAIVCAQVGNVDTGAFDPLERIADACEDAWVQVDGVERSAAAILTAAAS
jgi:glutamate/tyrosine decarboxylase-like PLP-dependent enzyme